MRRLLRPAVVLLAGALVLRVDPVLGVAAGLAVWASLSWWLPARAIDSVTLTKDHPERVFHGESVPISYEISASGRVPWLSVLDAIPFELGPSVRWVTSVDTEEVARHAVTVTASRRGLHRLGPTVITSGDTFAGREVRATGLRSSTVLVYPRIVPIESLGLTARALEQLRPTRRPLPPDPCRVVGVRDYLPGDSLRSIHWTATARLGSLQTKKLRPSTSRTVLLVADLSSPHHPVPGRRRSGELSVTAAASIAHHLVTVGNEAVALRAWCVDSPTGVEGLVETPAGQGVSRLSVLLEQLARVELTRRPVPERLLDPSGLPFGSAVVFFVGVVGEAHAAPLIRLRRLGFEVSVVTTAGDRHRSIWDGGLEALGIPVSPVSFYEEIADL